MSTVALAYLDEDGKVVQVSEEDPLPLRGSEENEDN